MARAFPWSSCPPFSKTNFVDHTTTVQSSILRFIEDDWQTSRTGNFSFDDKAGNLNDLLTFTDSANGNKQRWQRAVPGPSTGKPPAGTDRT
jgi:phospholipase C